MEEKEDEVKPIDWYSSGLYIPLPSEEDCGEETTATTAAEHQIRNILDNKYSNRNQLWLNLNKKL